MVKRKQIEELYYIRAIAALGILIIHATGMFVMRSEFNSKAMFLGIFANQFFRFGSPIFMMISGLVLFYNYRTLEEFDIKKFYSKKVLYLGIPYVIWSIVYFSHRSYSAKMPFTIERLIILSKEILLGNSYPHLYFIVLIFQFYLILPILIKYLGKPMKERPIKTVAILFSLQAIILIYFRYFRIANATGILGFINKNYWKSILGWFFYFLFGGILGYHYETIAKLIEKHIKKIFLFYIFMVLLYVGQVYYNVWLNQGRTHYGRYGSIRPETLIYAISTIPILIWITRRMVGKLKIIKIFGTYSLGIYFAHPLVLEVIKLKLFNGYISFLGYGRVSSLFILVILGLVLTFLLVIIIASFKYRWILLGRIPQIRMLNKYNKPKQRV